MKKDNCHDYVTEAFRYYAFCGKPNGEELKQLRIVSPPEQRGGLCDLEAVQRTIDRLKTEPDGRQSLGCLELVYFEKPSRYPKRNEITQRIEQASLALGMSESGVNRRLRRVRTLMAMERGLRVGDEELSRFLS